MISIRKKIIILLSIISLFFIGGAIIWQRWELNRVESLTQNQLDEMKSQAEKIISSRAAVMCNVINDYASWDECVKFADKPNAEWAKTNLDSLANAYNLDGVWVLDRKFRTVYSNGKSTDKTRRIPPVSQLELSEIFATPRTSHFFISTPNGLVECAGSSIHRTASQPHTGASHGYMLITREWSKEYQKEISGSISGVLTFKTDEPDHLYTEQTNASAGRLVIGLPLNGWHGSPVNSLAIVYDKPLLRMFYHSISNGMRAFIILLFVILIILVNSLFRWVSKPLQSIASSLKTESLTPISSMMEDRTEIGEMSRLIAAFFQQKNALYNEILVRKSMEREMVTMQQELEKHVGDRTSELAAANQELESKIYEHEQSEHSIRALYMQQERRLRHMAAVQKIEQAVIAFTDQRTILQMVLDEVVTQLLVDAADVLLYDPEDQKLCMSVSKGLQSTGMINLCRKLGEGQAGNCALKRQFVQITDLSTDPNTLGNSPYVHEEAFVAYFAVPLIARNQLYGVLEVMNRTALDVSSEWIDLLQTLAGQCAIALDNTAMFKQMQQANNELRMAYDATIQGWSNALELRDQETEGHSKRVTEMTLLICKQMGMSDEQLLQAKRGALLHDIGKMGIPDSILLKPGKLSDEEWVIMRMHPTYAHDLLNKIEFLRPALDIPWRHHEKWDGTGYPHGLKGEEIPLQARIFAAVDIWDALRSDRPYRKAMPVAEVREYMLSIAGSHLDAEVVSLFIEMMDKNEPVVQLKLAA